MPKHDSKQIQTSTRVQPSRPQQPASDSIDSNLVTMSPYEWGYNDPILLYYNRRCFLTLSYTLLLRILISILYLSMVYSSECRSRPMWGFFNLQSFVFSCSVRHCIALFLYIFFNYSAFFTLLCFFHLAFSLTLIISL